MNGTSSSNNSGNFSSASTANDENAPFLGTPYIMDMQRPYEYPFPSPATESCPSLLLPYTHSIAGHNTNATPMALIHPFPGYSTTSSSSSTSSSIASTTPPSVSSLVHRTHSVDPHHRGGHMREGSGVNPYPGTSGVHPPISFRPSTLLRRRSSSHENIHPLSALSSDSVPVPPRLLGRDLSGGQVGAGNGRWRRGRRPGSDGGEAPVK